MMLSKIPSLLASFSGGRVVAAAGALPASGLLTKALGLRGFAAGQEEDKDEPGNNTYERFKDVASQSGDPVKEWIQGSKEHASAYSQSAEQLYEATKRATQDITTHAKEAMARGGLKDVKQMASDATKGSSMAAAVAEAVDAVGSKASEAARKTAEVVKEGVGDLHDLPSARAKFEASRSGAQKAEMNKDRKTQLTDEVVGDNPAEQHTRDEHQILPNEFYTRH